MNQGLYDKKVGYLLPELRYFL